MKAVMSSIAEMVFSVGSVQSCYKRSAEASSVQGNYESVVSWKSESRRNFSSEVPE
jgi:hypothetical protein